MVDVGDDLTYDWDDGTNGGATHIDKWGWDCATENGIDYMATISHYMIIIA